VPSSTIDTMAKIHSRTGHALLGPDAIDGLEERVRHFTRYDELKSIGRTRKGTV